jgi:hypothetical protein
MTGRGQDKEVLEKLVVTDMVPTVPNQLPTDPSECVTQQTERLPGLRNAPVPRLPVNLPALVQVRVMDLLPFLTALLVLDLASVQVHRFDRSQCMFQY